MPDSSLPVDDTPENNETKVVEGGQSFDDAVANLQENAEKVTKAEAAFKRAFVPFCEELYQFGTAYDKEIIVQWLAAKGLKVTASANEWTAATKLAFAFEKDGKWVVNDQQVSKYTKVMEYAQREKISVGGVGTWIGSNSFTDMVLAARHKGGKPHHPTADEIKEKIDEQCKALKQAWGPVLDGKTLEPIDLTDAPIGKGYVQIFAELSDTGDFSLLGMRQAEPASFLKLITPPSATMLDLSAMNTVSGVKELFRFGSFIPVSSGYKGKITRGVVLHVEQDRWLFHAFKSPAQSSPVAHA